MRVRQDELKKLAARLRAESNNGEFDPGSERTLAARLNNGEFDPGSERTLAARFKHASRAVRSLR